MMEPWYTELCETFTMLCQRAAMDVPEFGVLENEPDFGSFEDGQDYTYGKKVLFSRQGDRDNPHRAHHLFGHWICDKHEYGEEDKVADLIADLLVKAGY